MSRRIVDVGGLKTVQANIVEAFEHDCSQRRRAAKFPAGLSASGQYFDEPEENQRGLHGTAAAVRVLGSAAANPASPSRLTAAGLVAYLSDRDAIENTRAQAVQAQRLKEGGAQKDEVAYWADKLRHDRVNTSKQADLLYSLQFIQPGVAPTEPLQVATAELLDNGRALDSRGWGWTLDRPSTSSELATAYVVRGLSLRGKDVRQEMGWLCESLTDRHRGTPDSRTLKGDCLILRVLVEARAIDESVARTILDKLWRQLADDLNQNALRQRFRETGPDHYVLIHWQLHLIALTALLRPFRLYLAPPVQGYLTTLANSVASRGSLNPEHDGDSASTRDYGYLYDTIEQCLSNRPRTGLPDRSVVWLVDTAAGIRRIGLGAMWTLATVTALAVLAAVLYSWISGNDAWYGSLGAELVGSALATVAAAGFRSFRHRKTNVHNL